MAEDPRQARTRAALTAALLRLLEDESLTSISVAALCAEAGVHRTTFYKHASSIEEFAVDVVTRQLDAIAAVELVETGVDLVDPLDAYKRAMVDVFEHVAGERGLYRPLLASPWSGALKAAIDERMQIRVRIALDVFEGLDGVAVPAYREEIVAFVSGGLVGTIALWALSDETDTKLWAVRTQELMPAWWPVRD